MLGCGRFFNTRVCNRLQGRAEKAFYYFFWSSNPGLNRVYRGNRGHFLFVCLLSFFPAHYPFRTILLFDRDSFTIDGTNQNRTRLICCGNLPLLVERIKILCRIFHNFFCAALRERNSGKFLHCLCRFIKRPLHSTLNHDSLNLVGKRTPGKFHGFVFRVNTLLLGAPIGSPLYQYFSEDRLLSALMNIASLIQPSGKIIRYYFKLRSHIPISSCTYMCLQQFAVHFPRTLQLFSFHLVKWLIHSIRKHPFFKFCKFSSCIKACTCIFCVCFNLFKRVQTTQCRNFHHSLHLAHHLRGVICL